MNEGIFVILIRKIIVWIFVCIWGTSHLAAQTASNEKSNAFGFNGKKFTLLVNGYFSPNPELEKVFSSPDTFEPDTLGTRMKEKTYLPPKFSLQAGYTISSEISFLLGLEVVRQPNFTITYPNIEYSYFNYSKEAYAIVESQVRMLEMGFQMYKEYAPYGSYAKISVRIGQLQTTTYNTQIEQFTENTGIKVIRSIKSPEQEDKILIGGIVLGIGKQVPIWNHFVLNYGLQGSLTVPLENSNVEATRWAAQGVLENQLIEVYLGMGILR